jgi:hypothetical protein
MTSARLLLCVLPLIAPPVVGEAWKAAGEADRQEIGPDLAYTKHSATRPSDGKRAVAHLALFNSRAFRLEVVDFGGDSNGAGATLAAALGAAGCPAGVNGGFFHPNRRPAGLVIAQARRINRFETARLLSGVIYSDGEGIHLMRRGRLQDHPRIDALLQSGPYLVEDARAVRGLSASDPRRRTFIATDWRGRWAIGTTLGPLTLADLAECLASPGALLPWRVDRAPNFDGGTSSGFYLAGQAGHPAVSLAPFEAGP